MSPARDRPASEATSRPESLDPALISVCLPTRHRPGLLRECLDSLVKNDYRPLEIVIGDNSENDASEQVVAAFQAPKGVSIRYQRHQPVVDFAANHNWVIEAARGARMLLMHDDDLMLPGGIDRLNRAWHESINPVIVYGKLQQLTPQGALDEAETARYNEMQLQMPRYAGPQQSKDLAALVQQIPPNGWLLDGAVLKRLGIRSPAQVGSYTDIDLGMRLAKETPGRAFIYVDEFTNGMRQGPDRLSSNRAVDIGAIRFLAIVEQFEPEPAARGAYETLLGELTRLSVVEAARRGDRSRALQLLRSPFYDRSMLSPDTLYRLLCIWSPRMATLANRLLRGV